MKNTSKKACHKGFENTQINLATKAFLWKQIENTRKKACHKGFENTQINIVIKSFPCK
jgi:hypothetical protein